jgi:hypothetical protein
MRALEVFSDILFSSFDNGDELVRTPISLPNSELGGTVYTASASG